jgi:hypothetical protein
MAIAGTQLAGYGLPAIRDVTCMQVNALMELSAVMMRMRCRQKVSMRSNTPQDIIAKPSWRGRCLAKDPIDGYRKVAAKSVSATRPHTY